ncbi:MAG: response regulator [Polyangiaceae bacterium]
MARILVIEDEVDLQHVLEYNLRQAGHEIFVASKGAEGLRLAREKKVDLVLLDLMLPDLQGTEVCRLLKSDPDTKTVPVVMVTAKGEESDRVVGFELGADDYVVKPFSVRELLLRITAVLRRAQQPTDESPIEFGVLRIDRAAHRVWVQGDEVDFTPIEFRLLVTLYERRNRVQSRAALLDNVWDVRGGRWPSSRPTVGLREAPAGEARASARLRRDRARRRRFVGTPDEAGR